MEIVSMDEFRKNPQLKQKDLDHLKEWAGKEEELPEIPEIQLALFLSSCDYCLETTKKTIKSNYLWRIEQPDYFLKRNLNDDPLLVHSSDLVSFVVLPKRTSQNEMIMVTRIISKETKNFDFVASLKSFFMHADAFALQNGSCNGLIILYDCAPVTFAHAKKVSLPACKQLFFYLQEAIAIKVNAIHYFNVHPIFDWLFSLFKPFIKQDLTSKIDAVRLLIDVGHSGMSMVHAYRLPRYFADILAFSSTSFLFFHKPGSDTIFAHLPPALVPKLFNGEESTSLMSLHEKSKEMIRSFEPWFEEEEKALLKKMPPPGARKKVENEELEITATFKQLEFD